MITQPLPKRVRLSDLLKNLLEETKGSERVSLGKMVEVFGTRAYGPLLLMFAIPNALPSIPGLLAILGLPLLFLAVQMMLGRVPWLPDFLARQSIPYDSLVRLEAKAYPWLIKADKIVKPRFLWLTTPAAERVVGVGVLILSLSVFTPIPFTNMLPALSICVISIGILERDGIWVSVGVVMGTAAMILVTTVIWTVVSALFGAF